MADKNQLSLVLKAVDEITAPLRAVSGKIAAMTAPVRALGAGFKTLGHDAGIHRLAEGVHKVKEHLGETVEHAKRLGETLLLGEVVGVAALYEITKGAVEAGAELKHAAERAGLTVDTYAQLQYAAGQAGVKQEEFTDAMDKFNKSLGQAKAGSGPLLEFLNKVSPPLAQQVKHSKNMTDALGLMKKAFGKELQNPMKTAALQQAVFGKSSREMGKFMGMSAEETAALMKEFDKLAGPQQEFADNSEEAEKALKTMGVAFDGVRNSAATGLMPALTELARAIADIVSSHRADIAEWASKAGKAISAWVEKGGITDLIKGFKEMAKSVGDAVEKIGGFKTVAIAVAAVMAGPLLMSVVGLTGSLLGLVPAIARVAFSLASFVLGPIIAAFGALFTAIAAGYPIMEAFNLVLISNPIGATIAAVTALAGAAYLLYKNWDGVKAFFESIWESMKHPIEALKTAGTFWGGVVDKVGAGVMGLKSPEELNQGQPGNYFGKGGAPAAQQAQTKVTVDFNNVPKGVRVTQDKGGTADVDVNTGWNSWVPG